MPTRSLSLSALALLACGGASTAHPAPAPAPAPSGGDRTGALSATSTAQVSAAPARPLPTCTAGELHALATLTDGVPAMAAVARREQGGLVAYVIDANRDGATELMLQPLDAEGASHGNAVTVASGHPAHPALVAHGDGYVLAWRDGAPGEERIELRNVGPDGAVGAAIAVHGVEPGWLGAPALIDTAEGAVIAVAHDTERARDPEARRASAIVWGRIGDAPLTRVAAPEGGAFDAERAPVLAVSNGAPRAFALTLARDAGPEGERALVEIPASGNALTVIARDVAAPSALALGERVFLAWRALAGAHGVAARVYPLPAHGAPDVPALTVATFGGAFGAEVGLVPLDPASGAESLVGAFTVSTLADDAGGTLNMSVLGADGQYVGRAPLLVSSLVRNARVVSAPRTETHADAWFVLEARGDAGSGPALGLAPLHCDDARAHPVDARTVPPPGLVQQLEDPEAPPAQLGEHSAEHGTCSDAGPTVVFAHHTSGAASALAGTRASAVPLASRTVLFAMVRGPDAPSPRLMVTSANASAVPAAPRVALEDARALWSTTAVGTSALALATRGEGEHAQTVLLTADSTGRVRAPIALPLASVSSATLVPATGDVIAVAQDPHGDVSLYRARFRNGRLDPPALLAALRPGDRVLDAVHANAVTTVLLARPDALGNTVTQAFAQLTVPDRESAPRGHFARDPFADPLSYGRGDAALVPTADGVAMASTRGPVLRAATLAHGELHEPRSVLGVYPHGGALLASNSAQGPGRWLALASGTPEDAARSAAPVTLAHLGGTGALDAVDAVPANDPGALTAGVSIATQGPVVDTVYPRLVSDGSVEWVLTRRTCAIEAQAAGHGRQR